MLTTNPYLHFNGRAEEAILFYRSVFGGEITALQRYKDIPGGEKMPASSQEQLIHASLAVNERFAIMTTDVPESSETPLLAGNNFHICIQATSEEETNRIFAALSAGGTLTMPLNKTFWGAYFGMCVDQFGTQWMINYTYQS